MARARVLVTALAVAVLLVACADDGGESGGSAADGAPEDTPELVEGVEVRVSAIDNIFRPETTTVQAGTEVLWTNDGRNDHNIVPVSGDDDLGAEVEDFVPGAEYRHRFTEPGEYRYYCSLHGTADAGMIGTIVVEG